MNPMANQVIIDKGVVFAYELYFKFAGRFWQKLEVYENKLNTRFTLHLNDVKEQIRTGAYPDYVALISNLRNRVAETYSIVRSLNLEKRYKSEFLNVLKKCDGYAKVTLFTSQVGEKFIERYNHYGSKAILLNWLEGIIRSPNVDSHVKSVGAMFHSSISKTNDDFEKCFNDSLKHFAVRMVDNRASTVSKPRVSKRQVERAPQSRGPPPSDFSNGEWMRALHRLENVPVIIDQSRNLQRFVADAVAYKSEEIAKRVANLPKQNGEERNRKTLMQAHLAVATDKTRKIGSDEIATTTRTRSDISQSRKRKRTAEEEVDLIAGLPPIFLGATLEHSNEILKQDNQAKRLLGS
eukprot:TRINITY_DN779916_c0_g1_i1.p1 TRINITY_DN779916_c0_g1~~TRINITY_DN779916_c0_g1_i1.p1  ORF type:complete len:351 (+),score=33.24 TRINITY_DN779916_c0_g1_i1:100-1152(+)